MRCVLCLDGHLDTAEMYAVGLEVAGYNSAVAVDREEALDFVRRVHPNAFVVDLGAASEDGWKLIRDLRDDPLARNMPVILLAGRIDGFTPASAKALGCGPLILKPCLPDTLAAVLRQVLLHAPDDTGGVPVNADNPTGAKWNAPA
jgi:CheY-like chemotaxis protein